MARGSCRSYRAQALQCEPTDWSPDGRHLIVNTRAAVFGVRAGDVWRVPVDEGRFGRGDTLRAVPRV